MRRLHVYISNDADSEGAVREFMKAVFADDGWEIVMGDRSSLRGLPAAPEAEGVDEPSETTCRTALKSGG